MIAMKGREHMGLGSIIFLIRDLVFKVGGLIFWPAFTQLDPTKTRRLKALKIIFICHISGFVALMLALFVLLLFFDIRAPQIIGYAETLGKVSIAASLVAIMLTRRGPPKANGRL